MIVPKVLLKLRGKYSDALFHATGSAYTCNPPSTDTDIDWIVLSTDVIRDVICELLYSHGYTCPEAIVGVDYNDCISYRKGNVNIIVCYDVNYYYSWVHATEICKLLNIQSKALRKQIHRINCGDDGDD